MIITTLLDNGAFFALTGAFAGLMAGVLGIGGGMIVVPALAYIFHHTVSIPSNIEMHMAAGTSLTIMIFTAQASVRAHNKQGKLLWKIYHHIWPGIIPGAISGALLANQLSTHWLKVILGFVLLAIAFKMLGNIRLPKPHQFPRPWINRFISFLIGFKSGLLGLGGGALIIPYLTYCGVDTRKIPAISALCTLTVAVIGSLSFMIMGSSQPNIPSYSTGYVFLPAVVFVAIPSMLFAPIGARLTYVLPVKELKYGFVVILIFAGLDLLF